MQKLSILACILLFSLSTYAGGQQSDETVYYIGDARWIPLAAPIQAEQQVPMAIKKEILTSKGKIVETGTFPLKGGVVDTIFTLNIYETSLTVSNEDGSIVGTGSVDGTPWKWNRIEILAEDRIRNVRIHDVNYITPDRLIARKALSKDGATFMLFEIDARQTTLEGYLEKVRELRQQ